MRVKTAFVCTFTIMMVFLVVKSSCAQKTKIVARNWGPQSMLYLKGRYGRRYTSDDNKQQCCYKLDLDDLNGILKSYKGSVPVNS